MGSNQFFLKAIVHQNGLQITSLHLVMTPGELRIPVSISAQQWPMMSVNVCIINAR